MTDVLDHGYVNLVDSMGGDLSIVNAARTSYNTKREELSDADRGLINFLAEHRHGTPFEMVNLMFEVQAPIFVFREWHRHRIASINEMSGRYVELPRLFYVPARDQIRVQKGKAGAYTYERVEDDATAASFEADIRYMSGRAFDAYEEMLHDGLAKEVARLVLPVNTYSKMVWSCNLRSLMNFLSLRNDDRAQWEIHQYAAAIEEMAFEIAPVAMEAFVRHGRQAP